MKAVDYRLKCFKGNDPKACIDVSKSNNNPSLQALTLEMACMQGSKDGCTLVDKLQKSIKADSLYWSVALNRMQARFGIITVPRKPGSGSSFKRKSSYSADKIEGACLDVMLTIGDVISKKERRKLAMEKASSLAKKWKIPDATRYARIDDIRQSTMDFTYENLLYKTAINLEFKCTAEKGNVVVLFEETHPPMVEVLEKRFWQEFEKHIKNPLDL